MNKKKHRHTYKDNQLPRHSADKLQEELQIRWEELNLRVEEILARHQAQPYQVKPWLLHAIRDHRRQVATHWLLAICCLLATTYWTYTMTDYTACRQVTAAAILLEALFILATAYSLYAAVKIHLWEEPRLLDRYIPQMTLIVIAMMLVIPFATFGQLGDGLVITQAGTSSLNHAARVETIQTIDNTLNGL